MKCLFATAAILVALGLTETAQAQVVTTFLPPPAIVPSPPVVVAPSAPVVTYYSAPLYAPVVYPRRYVVPAPVVVRPRTYVVRPKVYVRGRPVRNTIRAFTP